MSEDSLARAAEAIADLPRDRRTLVAVDGVDGAGKTTFADRLAPRLDRPVVRACEDDFLNPAAIRHRRGRESPEGFFRDTYDLALLGRLLLDPFAAGRLLAREGKPTRPRYVLGQQRYFAACDPHSRASLVLAW